MQARLILPVAAVVLALAGCTGSSTRSSTPPPATTRTPSAGPSTPATGSTGPSAPTSPRKSPVPSTTRPAPPADRAHAVFAAMDEAHRVGQLLMAGASTTGIDSATASAITEDHVGSVILMGGDRVSVSGVAAVTARLQALAGGTRLFIATDQEGGEVQRLRGPGFSPIPSAVEQGSLAPMALQDAARTWGRELAAAGVNLDLAPVADTVPGPDFAPQNPPIGQLDRQFGYAPDVVAAHSTAFARGLAAAGVDATVKHFPGLGRVSANTDLSAGVTDSVTTRTDPYLAPFQAAVRAGVPFVLMSTAIYSRIDPGRPAAFSPTIVGGMLRGDLGFTGVVISDDLGGAEQVASYPVGDRAVNVVAAGGDIALTVSAQQIPQMAAALLQRARSDPAFRAKVDAAALRVLTAKQARGLL